MLLLKSKVCVWGSNRVIFDFQLDSDALTVILKSNRLDKSQLFLECCIILRTLSALIQCHCY